MNKTQIKKAHEAAVQNNMKSAIQDHAKYEAHRRVADALSEGRHDKDEPARAPEGGEPTSSHSTETGRKTGTKVIHPASIEHHLGRGRG